MKNIKHLQEVGETYFQHLLAALHISACLAISAFICLTHAFIPCIFTHTTSEIVEKLNQYLKQRGE